MKSLLKSKTQLSIPRKNGVVSAVVYAEGIYDNQTANTFTFRETYYYEEDLLVDNPLFGKMGELEQITITNRVNLESETQTKTIAEIDSFFDVYGSDITKVVGYSTGVDINFKLIFSSVVKANANYGVVASDWEIVE